MKKKKISRGFYYVLAHYYLSDDVIGHMVTNMCVCMSLYVEIMFSVLSRAMGDVYRRCGIVS